MYLGVHVAILVICAFLLDPNTVLFEVSARPFCVFWAVAVRVVLPAYVSSVSVLKQPVRDFALEMTPETDNRDMGKATRWS